MSLMYRILFTEHGFETSKLAFLPPKDFAVFERQFLLEYYTERAKYFNMHLILLAL